MTGLKIPFTKLKVGKCEVTWDSTNYMKVEIEQQKNDKGETIGLRFSGQCPCDATLPSYEIQDMSAIITEGLVQERRRANELRQTAQYLINRISTFTGDCTVCGRGHSLSVNSTLVNSWVDKFIERNRHGKETMRYGECLEFSVEIQDGFFAESTERRKLEDITHPKHACGETFYPEKLLNATQQAIEKINSFWENSSIDGELKPVSIDDEIKCRYCLGKAKIKATITPVIPKSLSPSEAVRLHKYWLERMA